MAAERPTRPRLLRIVAAVALLGAVCVWTVTRIDTSLRARLPLRPLVVAPDLVFASSLPVPDGALAGRSVVLVTLDTTRPDRLGIYGCKDAGTPNLDALAREGAVFSNAYATAPSTLPSHASILTGLLPHRHGAPANGVFAVDPSVETLAGILARRGYATAAFVSAFPLDARFGLARGFDVYDDRTSRQAGGLNFAERTGDQTTRRAVAWLREHPEGPFLLWVHYYDPHARYRPPEPFASRHAHPYDGEIAFVDHQLGRLLAALSRTPERDAVVVVVADHGEALGEHGEDTHGHLVQEATLRVPLLLRAPGVVPEGVHVDTRVSQADLLPTLLGWLGVPVPKGLDGRSLSAPPDPGRSVLAEGLEGRVSFGWSRLSALYHGPLKLVDGGYPALYDLADDPRERRDVARARAEDVRRLRALLRETRGGDGGLLRPSSGLLGRDARRRLAALGYVVDEGGGRAPAIAADGPGPDPREQMVRLSRLKLAAAAPSYADRLSLLTRLVAWARGLALPRTPEDAIAELEAMASRHPDFAPTWLYLNELYTEAGRPEDARRALARLEAVRRAAVETSRSDRPAVR